MIDLWIAFRKLCSGRQAGLGHVRSRDGRCPARSGPSSVPRIAVTRAHFTDVIRPYYHHICGQTPRDHSR
jgi:hypothetical protein